MVKVDFSRDYYGDLELPSTADSETIKRQYRKLALKYHPDRNPGKEMEYSQKFQTIQSAHEVLTNVEQKVKYDNFRRTRNSTAASGVKGNPWANAGSSWAPPPKPPARATRPPMPRRQTTASGAEKYAEFTKEAPPTSPRYPRKAPETSKAWDDMRQGPKSRGNQNTGAGASARPATEPPKVPPRANAQRPQKGSFGNRVNRGYTPSTAAADEPPVTNKNYSTTRMHTNLFNETSAAGRAQRPSASGSDPMSQFRDSSFVDMRQSTPYQTRGGEKLNPFDGANIGRSRSTRETSHGANDEDRETSPTPSQRQRSFSVTNDSENVNFNGGKDASAGSTGFSSNSDGRHRNRNGASGGGPYTAPTSSSSSLNDGEANTTGDAGLKDKGNNVFNFQFGQDTFTPDPHRFTRNSADNINTRFVAEEDGASSWQFNAGSPVTETGLPKVPPRSKSGSRSGRRNTKCAQSRQASFVEATDESTTAKPGAFDPQEWSKKIGPQVFEPPLQHKSSISPTRPIRMPSKKTKPVRMTMGTAGMVESDESSGQDELPKQAPAAANPVDEHVMNGTDSPNAMDIDSPPPKSDMNGVRNIPVEPSRPEWRAGVVNGIKPEDAKPAFVSVAGGSEDSEEFKTTFADFRKVEPFAEHATGLESFGDLKSSLPFPSRASAHVPIKKEKVKPVKLHLPDPPRAPHPPAASAVPSLKPSAAAWQKYVNEFYMYLAEWHRYNNKFTDHFHARGLEVSKKLNTTGWLESRDDGDLQEYLHWQNEDQEVRAKWTQACNEHENKVREFAAYRVRIV